MARKNKSRGLTSAQAVEENECEHGTEVRERWGNEVADASNKKVAGMSATQWEAARQLQADILTQLGVALAIGDPAGPEAQQLVDMHARWLKLFCPEGLYCLERHCGLVDMYLVDERFCANYDVVSPDACQFFGRRRARQTFARFIYYCLKHFCDALFTHLFGSPYYHESD